MSTTAVDTSIVVAALLEWHEAHELAFTSLSTALDKEEVAVPASALFEAYSVMTRLPHPHRLSPRDASTVLARSLKQHARVVGLRPKRVWSVLEGFSREGVAGGAAYDGRILAEAQAGGAERLLTLNARDFERLGTDGITIVTPGDESA